MARLKKPVEQVVVKETPIVKEAPVVEEVKVEQAPTPQAQQVFVVKEEVKKRDLTDLVCVTSLKNNPLIYVSKTQPGYEVTWENYGVEQWMEFRELVAMRGSQSSFFKKNWIICDIEILKELKVDSHYKEMIDLDDIDSLFDKSASEFETIVKASSDGVRQLIFDRAAGKYVENSLDSLAIVKVLKEKFNFDLELLK